jgi:hypothetical protein
VRSLVLDCKARLIKSIDAFGKLLTDFIRIEMRVKYPNGPHKLPEENAKR